MNRLTIVSPFLAVYCLINTISVQGKDRIVGKAILTVITALFAYYVVWVLILPLLPDGGENTFRNLFPSDNTFAIAVPVVAGTLFFAGLSGFALYHLNREDAD